MDVTTTDGLACLPEGFDLLVQRCTERDDHAPFGEHTLLALHGARQVRHARVDVRRTGRLAGVAVLSEGLEAWYVELAVHPDERGAGVGSSLLDAVRAHVASHGGGLLRGWAHAAGPAVEHLARGWTASRTLHVLSRSLDRLPDVGPVPAGCVLRSLDPSDPADRAAWRALSNAAFVDHPENGGWSQSEVDWRMRADWTDGARFPVVSDDQGLVAGVWTKIDPAGGTRRGDGELHVVAVAPRRQGAGLGRLVVQEALRCLAAAGSRRAFLYVDRDNLAARALYGRTGFSDHHVDRCLQVQVHARLLDSAT